MVWIVVCILLIIELFAWMTYRDYLCPAVLHNVLWIIAITFSSTFTMYSSMSISACLIVIFGSIAFQLAFPLGYRGTLGKREYPYGYSICVNRQTIKVLIIVLSIVSLPVIYQYMVYLRGAGTSIYNMLRFAEDELNLPSLFKYYRKIVQFITLAFLANYWLLNDLEKKKIKKYVVILFVIAALSVLSLPTRNGILFFVLPLFLIYLITNNASERKIFFLGLIGVLGFMMIFYAVSISKYWYIYDDATSRLDIIKNEIGVYLSGSILAFGQSVESHSYTALGQNTFRFIIAVADKAFGTNNAVALVQDFVTIAPGTSTNVFTFYDFYLRDFGAFYAVFMQFFVGCIHGWSYQRLYYGSPANIFIFSLLMYPLVMQFFQDQYISLLSTWCQIAIVGFVIFRTKIFFVTEPIYEGDSVI